MATQHSVISPLRQRMIDDMRMRKFGDKTPLDYIRAVRNFSAYLGRSPDTATVEDLRNYQLHLIDQRISPASLNSAISGLKFFFCITLDRGELMAKIQPVRLPRKLPVILSREEVSRLISAAGNLKHQTALSVAYGTGLRVNEVVNLKVGDIDSQRMTLRVEQGKGLKDRFELTLEMSEFLNKADFGTSTENDTNSDLRDRIPFHHLFANNQGLFFILFM